MGNVWCCQPRRLIIDYSQRKIVVSQGVQCNLINSPINCCGNLKMPLISQSNSNQNHQYCHCCYPTPAGDCEKQCFNNHHCCSDTIKTSNSQLNVRLPKPEKNKDNQDALVSLSETFSESSLEEFLQRKRLKQKQKVCNLKKSQSISNLTHSRYSIVKEENNLSNSTPDSNEELRYSEIKPKRKMHFKKRRRDSDVSSNNSTSTSGTLELHNSKSHHKSCKSDLNNSVDDYSPVMPKKSILKNTDNILTDINETSEENDKSDCLKSNYLHRSMSLYSEKLASNTNNRTSSVLSNHDSLDQLMSLLKFDKTITSTLNLEDDEFCGVSKISSTKPCQSAHLIDKNNPVSKSVNFINTSAKNDGPTIKSNLLKLSDGRIKKRFLLRETHKLFDILNDPNDRRIRSICDRYQCDMEIYVRPPKIGLMYFAVEILAPDKFSLRMCARELDSSMKWCISSQLY